MNEIINNIEKDINNYLIDLDYLVEYGILLLKKHQGPHINNFEIIKACFKKQILQARTMIYLYKVSDNLLFDDISSKYSILRIILENFYEIHFLVDLFEDSGGDGEEFQIRMSMKHLSVLVKFLINRDKESSLFDSSEINTNNGNEDLIIKKINEILQKIATNLEKSETIKKKVEFHKELLSKIDKVKIFINNIKENKTNGKYDLLDSISNFGFKDKRNSMYSKHFFDIIYLESSDYIHTTFNSILKIMYFDEKDIIEKQFEILVHTITLISLTYKVLDIYLSNLRNHSKINLDEYQNNCLIIISRHIDKISDKLYLKQ